MPLHICICAADATLCICVTSKEPKEMGPSPATQSWVSAPESSLLCALVPPLSFYYQGWWFVASHMEVS